MKELKIYLAIVGAILIIGGLIGIDTAIQLSNIQIGDINTLYNQIIDLGKAFILYTLSLLEIVGGITIILYITKIE
jgi:hypothetical protein